MTSKYEDKLERYVYEGPMWMGRLPNFCDYYREFGQIQKGHGIDIGCGPKAVATPMFTSCTTLDACDSEQCVVDSRPKEYGGKCFQYFLGSKDPLPYKDGELDFAWCSCVIQHLNSWEELQIGLREIRRILRKGGQFMLIFKCGVNDTKFTHFNPDYGYERSFRVFDPECVKKEMQSIGFSIVKDDKAVDDLFHAYSFLRVEAA